MVHQLSGPLTSEAISYAWRQLIKRAGASHDTFPARFAYGQHRAACLPTVAVDACDARAWHHLLRQAPNALSWIPLRDALPEGADVPLAGPVPVLFWGQNANSERRQFAELRSDGMLVFYADIIASTLFMLARWEETVVPVRDAHDRFPATASVAYKQGFLDRPIVDEYALILREWLKVLLPGWHPTLPSFRFFLTHDVDHPVSPTPPGQAVRYAVGDVIRRHSLSQALRRLQHLVRARLDVNNDVWYSGLRTLMQESERHRLSSAFYFMASLGGPFEAGYSPGQSPTGDLIQEALTRGHQIGFHPGYSTFRDLERFLEERDRLAAVLGHTDFGGRQHYLRFKVPDTWRIWEEAGLLYDSTLGYADQIGFRCGTCHPFRPFDIERDREMDIWERPLIAMDTCLRTYSEMSPSEATESILQHARACKRVSGEFVLLWHNASPDMEWHPSAGMYSRIVRKLVQMVSEGGHT